jgi:hypothetical protein
MQSLDKRLRLLEAWMQPTGCLECECERLNAPARLARSSAHRCTHRRGLTLLEGLRGLNPTEAINANA